MIILMLVRFFAFWSLDHKSFFSGPLDHKNSLSKHRIELLGDIVLLVRNPLGAEVEDEVGVGLAVDVHRVEVVGLHHVGADKHPDRLVAGKSLQQVFLNFF